MAGLEIKNAKQPDERRPMSGKGEVQVVKIGDHSAMAGTWEPGWRWSEHMKPIAGTDSCEATHLIYGISGKMHVVMNDGTEGDVGAGDFCRSAPAMTPGWSVTSRLSASISAGTPSTRRGSVESARVLDPDGRILPRCDGSRISAAAGDRTRARRTAALVVSAAAASSTVSCVRSDRSRTDRPVDARARRTGPPRRWCRR